MDIPTNTSPFIEYLNNNVNSNFNGNSNIGHRFSLYPIPLKKGIDILKVKIYIPLFISYYACKKKENNLLPLYHV